MSIELKLPFVEDESSIIFTSDNLGVVLFNCNLDANSYQTDCY